LTINTSDLSNNIILNPITTIQIDSSTEKIELSIPSKMLFCNRVFMKSHLTHKDHWLALIEWPSWLIFYPTRRFSYTQKFLLQSNI